MSSTLQQAEKGYLEDSLKSESERDGALLDRLRAAILTLQASAGQARLLHITARHLLHTPFF